MSAIPVLRVRDVNHSPRGRFGLLIICTLYNSKGSNWSGLTVVGEDPDLVLTRPCEHRSSMGDLKRGHGARPPTIWNGTKSDWMV